MSDQRVSKETITLALASGSGPEAHTSRTIGDLISSLTRDNHAVAVEIASLPESIRGYGHIKAKAVHEARGKLDTLLARFRAP